uniref:Ubiquitin-like domain-containing protein n=1 Tax=Anser cygnoides TaxID=8845 RepID=A0A8B9E764_ANSCY
MTAAGPGPGPGPGAGPGAVSLAVSSSLNAFRAHKRYGTGLTIAEFKCKLELVVGSPASCMELELYGPAEELLGRLDCDEALLGSYPVADGCRVHVGPLFAAPRFPPFFAPKSGPEALPPPFPHPNPLVPPFSPQNRARKCCCPLSPPQNRALNRC